MNISIIKSALTSKRFALAILVLTSLVCSRTMFLLFDDPEGPNLLVVTVGATIIYSISLVTYKIILRLFSLAPHVGSGRVLLLILIQVVVSAILYICLTWV